MKTNFLRNITASSLQQLINQFLSVIVFLITSAKLSKQDFGDLNWALAFFLFAFNILSFGLDQIIVKKIAQNEHKGRLANLYLFHVIVIGGSFYFLITVLFFVFPNNQILLLLLIVGLGKLMLFISSPFKQIMAGCERFHLFSSMSIVSNIFKACVLGLFFVANSLNIQRIALIFLAGDSIELFVSLILFYKYMPKDKQSDFAFKEYFLLLKESLPQLGVVFFTSAISRLDWLLIGVLVSSKKLAEYSFAYKAFEVETLPLLIIAPLLLPRVSNTIKAGNLNDQFYSIAKIKLFIAFVGFIVINIIWQPVVDFITAGKYGAVNNATILLLTASTPFLYLNNFFWNIVFAEGRLKTIFNVFAITFLVNAISCLILIPLFNTEGAAFSFLLCQFAQLLLYLKIESFLVKIKIVRPFIFSLTVSSVIIAIIFFLNLPIWLGLTIAPIAFICIQVMTKTISLSNFHKFLLFMNGA